MAHRSAFALEGIFRGFTPAVQRPGYTGTLEPQGIPRPVVGKPRQSVHKQIPLARWIGANIAVSLHPMVHSPAIPGQVLKGLFEGVVPGRGAEGPAKRTRGGLGAGDPIIPDLAIGALDILQHQKWGLNRGCPLTSSPKTRYTDGRWSLLKHSRRARVLRNRKALE